MSSPVAGEGERLVEGERLWTAAVPSRRLYRTMPSGTAARGFVRGARGGQRGAYAPSLANGTPVRRRW